MPIYQPEKDRRAPELLLHALELVHAADPSVGVYLYGHCAPCTVGIEINMVNKLADLARMQDEVPDSVRGHYEALEVHADACVHCHACEPRCPFGVPIADRMDEAAELFA